MTYTRFRVYPDDSVLHEQDFEERDNSPGPTDDFQEITLPDCLVSHLCDGPAFVQVTMQNMVDAGLNAFAVKLLSESIADNNVKNAVRFKFKNVGITIEPLDC